MSARRYAAVVCRGMMRPGIPFAMYIATSLDSFDRLDALPVCPAAFAVDSFVSLVLSFMYIRKTVREGLTSPEASLWLGNHVGALLSEPAGQGGWLSIRPLQTSSNSFDRGYRHVALHALITALRREALASQVEHSTTMGPVTAACLARVICCSFCWGCSKVAQ